MASWKNMSSLCGLKFDCNILNIGRTHFVDYIKNGYDVFNNRWKFQVMLFGVSVISERNKILTLKKLELRICVASKSVASKGVRRGGGQGGALVRCRCMLPFWRSLMTESPGVYTTKKTRICSASETTTYGHNFLWGGGVTKTGQHIFVTLDTLLHCTCMLLTTEKQEVLQSADYLFLN